MAEKIQKPEANNVVNNTPKATKKVAPKKQTPSEELLHTTHTQEQQGSVPPSEGDNQDHITKEGQKNAPTTPQSALPPIQTKEGAKGVYQSPQGKKGVYQSPQGRKGPVKAKQTNIDRSAEREARRVEFGTLRTDFEEEEITKEATQKEEALTKLPMATPEPTTKGKKPDTKNRWSFKDFKEAYAEKIDDSLLTPKEQEFFKDYAKKAQFYLDRPGTSWAGKTPLTGEMFANAAKRMYLRYDKDMTKVVPLEMALSQAQFESHFGTYKGGRKSLPRNPYSIGEYNTHTADFVAEIKDAPMGVATYYHVMAEDYLSAKKPEELLQDFTNEVGNRYQVNDNGKVDRVYEQKLATQIRYIQKVLKQMPGGYNPTFNPSVVNTGGGSSTIAKRPARLTNTPLPTAKSGFSVGAPNSRYVAQLINYAPDVRKIQQKLLEVGLLSDVDYAKEYPQEQKQPVTKPDYSAIQPIESKGITTATKAPESPLETLKNQEKAQQQAALRQVQQALLQWLQSLSDNDVRAIAENPVFSSAFGEIVLQSGLTGVTSKGEMIAKLLELQGKTIAPIQSQGIEPAKEPTPAPLPYIHYMSDFEQVAMELYGKVPEGANIPASQLTKTIAAIETFQREVTGGTTDGRIDPNGNTLGQLMGATKDSVAQARKAYMEKKKKEEEEIKKLENKNEIISKIKVVIADLGDEFQKNILPLLENMPGGELIKLLGVLISIKGKGKTNKKKGKATRTPDFSINGIKKVMKKKGYKFYEDEGKVNLIAVRTDNVYDNKFSDKLFIIQKIKGKFDIINIPWTTTAGTLAHGGTLDPLSGKETGTGVSGTATIMENQYENVYTFKDSKNYQNLWLQYPYLEQIGNMNYYRDNDKDSKITRGKVYTGNYSTHIHRMSNNNVQSNQVNLPGVAWSQGCQGAPEPEFKKLLPFFRTHVQQGHEAITYTLLTYADFMD